MRPSVRASLCASAFLGVMLAGCGADDSPEGVLTADDLPDVASSSTPRGMNAVAICSPINDVQFSLTVSTEPQGVAVEYQRTESAGSGDYVSSHALGVLRRFGSTGKAMTAIEDAIEECSVDPFGESFTPMTDLPSGVIGYRAVTETSDDARIGERVFTVQGDRIIAVGVQHDGPGEPTVDVAELLPVALERAEDAPSE